MTYMCTFIHVSFIKIIIKLYYNTCMWYRYILYGMRYMYPFTPPEKRVIFPRNSSCLSLGVESMGRFTNICYLYNMRFVESHSLLLA